MNKERFAFTLVELMLAIVVGSIVMLAIGTVIAGMYHQQNTFAKQTGMQGEVQVIDFALRNEARKSIQGGLTCDSETQFSIDQQDGTLTKFFTRKGATVNSVQYYTLVMDRGGAETELSSVITSFSVVERFLEVKGLAIHYTIVDTNSTFQANRDLYVGGGRNSTALSFPIDDLMNNAPN